MSELSSLVAYIGPGLGAGTIAVILAVLVSVLFAIVAIVWYPLKRMFKRVTTSRSVADAEDEKTP